MVAGHFAVFGFEHVVGAHEAIETVGLFGLLDGYGGRCAGPARGHGARAGREPCVVDGDGERSLGRAGRVPVLRGALQRQAEAVFLLQRAVLVDGHAYRRALFAGGKADRCRRCAEELVVGQGVYLQHFHAIGGGAVGLESMQFDHEGIVGRQDGD